MQVVIALPGVRERRSLEILVWVAVLGRIVATALEAGGSKVLVILPPGLSHSWLIRRLQWQALELACIETAEIGRVFDPREPEDWEVIGHWLDDHFVWMPFDYLLRKTALIDPCAIATRVSGAICFSESCDRSFLTPATLEVAAAETLRPTFVATSISTGHS